MGPAFGTIEVDAPRTLPCRRLVHRINPWHVTVLDLPRHINPMRAT